MNAHPPGEGADSTRTLAVLFIGDLVFGVPVLALEQVVPRPASLASLPRAGQSLAGVLDFRGRAVPVVDLRQWRAGGQATCEPLTQVAVLVHGEHWLGVLIGGARGLTRVPSDRIQRLHHDDDPDEFFHSVAPGEGTGELLGLLDPGRLMRRAHTWSAAAGADDAASRVSQPAAGTTASHTQPHVVLRLGEGWYAFPAHAVAEVLPRPSLQAVWGQGSDSLGMLRWRGRDVPLVNPAVQLGVEATSDPAPWVVIVEDTLEDTSAEPTTIALACHGMDQVRSFPARQVQSADSAALLCAPACSGLVLSSQGHPIRLVDTGALVTRLGMRLNRASQPSVAQGVHQRGARNAVAYVVFQARTHMAVPIDRLHEIMPLPVDHAPPTPTGTGSTVGSVTWRGKVLPLVDLQRRLWPGQAPRTEARRILITEVDGQLAGLLVGEVDRIIPRHGGTLTQIHLREDQTVNMITVNRDGQQASYSLLEAV